MLGDQALREDEFLHLRTWTRLSAERRFKPEFRRTFTSYRTINDTGRAASHGIFRAARDRANPGLTGNPIGTES